jgi:hypothetical protein
VLFSARASCVSRYSWAVGLAPHVQAQTERTASGFKINTGLHTGPMIRLVRHQILAQDTRVGPLRILAKSLVQVSIFIWFRSKGLLGPTSQPLKIAQLTH